MNTVGSADMPLLSELIETCKLLGPEATMKALANARNQIISTKDDDPISQVIIKAVLTEMDISYEQLMSKDKKGATGGIKKFHGLIIASYCLVKLKYERKRIGIILNGRHRGQIYKYNKMMENAKNGRLAQCRPEFDVLIKTLSKKLKQKKNGRK